MKPYGQLFLLVFSVIYNFELEQKEMLVYKVVSVFCGLFCSNVKFLLFDTSLYGEITNMLSNAKITKHIPFKLFICPLNDIWIILLLSLAKKACDKLDFKMCSFLFYSWIHADVKLKPEVTFNHWYIHFWCKFYFYIRPRNKRANLH